MAEGDEKRKALMESLVTFSVILGKIGGKLLGVLAKFAKIFKSSKVLSAAAFFGAEAAVFNPLFALVLLASLFVHEYGHVWAMKREGMKVKKLYFIPFFGAVAVPEESFPSFSAEAKVALMGPIWGGLVGVAFAVAYLIFKLPLLGAIAGWVCLINLFNLLPVAPLDGGRAVRAIVLSTSHSLGLAFCVAAMGLLFVVGRYFGFGLLCILVPVAIIENFSARRYVRGERMVHELADLLKLEPSRSVLLKELDRLREFVDSEATPENLAIFPLYGNEDFRRRLDYKQIGQKKESLDGFRLRLYRAFTAFIVQNLQNRLASAWWKRVSEWSGRKADDSNEFIKINLAPDQRKKREKIKRSKWPWNMIDVRDELEKKTVPALTKSARRWAIAAYVVLLVVLGGILWASKHIPGADEALKFLRVNFWGLGPFLFVVMSVKIFAVCISSDWNYRDSRLLLSGRFWSLCQIRLSARE